MLNVPNRLSELLNRAHSSEGLREQVDHQSSVLYRATEQKQEVNTADHTNS